LSGKYEEAAITALTVGCAESNKLEEAENYLKMLKIKFPASKNTAAAAKTILAAKNKKVR